MDTWRADWKVERWGEQLAVMLDRWKVERSERKSVATLAAKRVA
jgi:hypothetical protein